MSKFSEKVKVTIDPAVGGIGDRKPLPEEMRLQFASAGWTDDPGTGKAIHTTDGREVLNPVPMAPPIGYVAEKSVMDMIDERIRAHRLLLDGDEEIDTEEEFDDFEVVEEFDPFSAYEIIDMQDDQPPLQPERSTAADSTKDVKSPEPVPPQAGEGGATAA